MIDVLQLARKAAEGRHAVSDGDAHSLRFDELERFTALVLGEAEQKAKAISDKYAFGYYGSEVDAVDGVVAAIRSLKPKGEE